MIKDFDDAYSNMKYIPDGADFPSLWSARSERFRENLPDGVTAQLNLSYGQAERHKIDIFAPAKPKGLCIFVHGGYWMAFQKSDWSHLASGALARGWAVAMPSYTLAPDMHVSDITLEIAEAIEFCADRIEGPIRLAGHSAGGHLVSRMVCHQSPLPEVISSRIAHVISISGVHDLRPLLNTAMNDTLGLTVAEAHQESPALLMPQPQTKLTCWVGAHERPEFIRQSQLLANIWLGLGADTKFHSANNRHHFDVIDDLCDGNSALTKVFAP